MRKRPARESRRAAAEARSLAKPAVVLELFAREDRPLPVRRDALLILDLGIDVLDRVGALDLERDGLTRHRRHCGI